MAKQVILNLKNPKYGQAGEPEYIQVPAGIGNNGELYNRISQLEKLEYNATQVTGNGYASLTEALNSVTQEKYKVNGIVLTWYDTTEQGWKSMRYVGADSAGWATVENWVETGGAGGSGNTNYYQIPAAVTELTSSSTSEEIQAAFGGDSGFLSVVKAVEEGAFLYIGINQNPNYVYMTIPYCLWRKAEVETDGVFGFSYDIPTQKTVVMEISKTRSNYEISITESSSSGGGGEGGGTETYFIPSTVMSMPEDTPPEDVLAAFGGIDGLNKFKEAVKSKNIGVEYDVTTEGAPAPFHYRIPVTDVLTAKISNEGQEITYYYLMFSEFDILTETNKAVRLILITMGDMVATGGKAYFGYGTNLPALNLTEAGYKIFRVDSRKIFVLELDEAMRNNYYRKIFTQSYEPYNPGEGDIWIQTT